MVQEGLFLMSFCLVKMMVPLAGSRAGFLTMLRFFKELLDRSVDQKEREWLAEAVRDLDALGDAAIVPPAGALEDSDLGFNSSVTWT